jgi:hypothetical protein
MFPNMWSRDGCSRRTRFLVPRALLLVLLASAAFSENAAGTTVRPPCNEYLRNLTHDKREGTFVLALEVGENGRLLRAAPEEVGPEALHPYADCVARHARFYLSNWLRIEPAVGKHRIPITVRTETPINEQT